MIALAAEACQEGVTWPGVATVALIVLAIPAMILAIGLADRWSS